jgi:hypothetical protein
VPDSFYRRFGLLCIFPGLSAQGSIVLLLVSFLVPAGWCSSDLSCCCAKDLILSTVQDLLAGLASGFIHATCFVSHRQLCSYKQVKVQCVFPLCVALISAGDRFYRSAGGEAFTAAAVRLSLQLTQV